MKKEKLFRLLFPAGLLILFVPMVLGFFIKMPDFVKGFTEGLGVTLAIGSFIVRARMKKKAAAGRA